MNSGNLKLLEKNQFFSNLVQKIPGSLNNLSRELPNFGTFIDDSVDLGVGRCFVEPQKPILDYLDLLDYQNTKQVEKQEPENTIKIVNVVKKLIYPIQKVITEIVENQGYSLEILEIHNFKYGNDLFYIMLISLYPNYHNFTNDLKSRYLNDFTRELSFSLGKRNTLKQYNYKGIISENTLQTALLDKNERAGLSFINTASFLSDYFNINIVVIIDKLVIESLHHDPERLCLLLFYKNGKYSICTNNYLTYLFPPIILTSIYDKCSELMVINKLQAVSRYKIKDVQDIAEKLDIETSYQADGKIKKKTKNTLYDEISKKIPR